MDLGAWLNFLSPEGPCFDPATLPIPGSPISLSMIDALVEAHIKSSEQEVRVLEIGSFCGISAVTWGRALERIGVRAYTIYCVDIWYHCGDIKYEAATTTIARGRNAFNHEIFKFNVSKTIGLQHVVEVIGDSRIALKGMRDGFFDVVYVDGAHGYDIVFQDITNAFRVCKRGGIICGDDYDCSARMMRAIPESARQLDEYVMPPSNVGVHPGVVLAVDALLGSPRLYSTFWAFSKVADRATAPFRDSVAPLDVSAFPRRIPAFIPTELRARFEAEFAGPNGLLPDHPMAAEAERVEDKAGDGGRG